MNSGFHAEIVSAMRAFYHGEPRDWELAGDLKLLSLADRDPLVPQAMWPALLHHGRPTRSALVLLHHLGGGPGRLQALATGLAADEAGLSVVLPRIAAPDPMLRFGWRQAVDHAIATARCLGAEVSIGAVSSSAVLALDALGRKGLEIDGALLLFSPLLPSTKSLAQHLPGLLWQRAADGRSGPDQHAGASGAGADQVSWELHDLTAELGPLEVLLGSGFGAGTGRRVFLAHSAADAVAPFSALPTEIRDVAEQFIVPAELGVTHFGVVADSCSPSEAGEKPNPRFQEMIARASAHLVGRPPGREVPHPEPASQDEVKHSEEKTQGQDRTTPESAGPGAEDPTDDYTRMLLDAQSARGTNPEEIRKVIRFANQAKDLRK